MWNKIFHLISILIGISALCLAYLRCEPLEKDWLGILVGILSLLVTVLLGTNIYTLLDLKKDWNIYKEYVNTKLSVIDKLNDEITEDRFRNKMALDANINLMQGEVYATSKLYLLAYREYISSLIRFNSSGDTDLQDSIIRKIEYCIRNVRKELCNDGYVLDWDFEDDVFHYKNISEIRESSILYHSLNVIECERIIKYLISKSDYILVSNFKFTIYRKDVEVKQRGDSIYALFKIDGRKCVHNKRVYGDYNLFINDILKDLKCDYDFIGICDSFIDMKESLNTIKCSEICEYKRCEV